jgi:hypothetical protein
MLKVVSGGQTGVDRAALDAALELGIECGGWCPGDRLAEDGAIPDIYPVQELERAGYRERTRQNVIDSDGTVIFFFTEPTGGTRQTIEFCLQALKPHLLVDAVTQTIEQAARSISDFISGHEIATLNVAGPRASQEPKAYDYAKEVIMKVIALQIDTA